MSNRYDIKEIEIDVFPGEHIESQKRKACIAALEHRCRVTFVHNDKQYRVEPNDLLGCCEQLDPD